jgi:hypothetical protein
MVFGVLHGRPVEPSGAEGPQPVTVYLPGESEMLKCPERPTFSLSTRGWEEKKTSTDPEVGWKPPG